MKPNHNIAFTKLRKWLSANDYKILKVDIINQGTSYEHYIYFTDRGNIYTLFKTDFFNTFSKQFNLPKEFSGSGESINVKNLKIAKSLYADIFFIHETGEVFEIHSMAFSHFIEKFGTVRVQDRTNFKKTPNYSGKLVLENEFTASVPRRLLKLICQLDMKI